MSRLIDISPPLRPGIPVWPGDTAYEEARSWEIAPGCPVNVSRLTLSSHTGAHADAPLHYDAEGVPVGGLALERYVGLCFVAHAIAPGARVRPEQVHQQLDAAHRARPETLERVLFRTYEAAPQDQWDSDFAAMSPELVDHLAGLGCGLIGIDTPSMDPESSKALEAHNAIRRHGMGILEGLVLDDVAVGVYELIALPLKLVNLDAAPVRAVLRELP